MAKVQQSKSRGLSKIWCILAAALVIKVFYFISSQKSPFFQPLLLDPEYYHNWALRILKGGGAGEGVFYGLPLYPYFLAACYKIFNTSVAAVKLIQILLGLVTIYFVYKAARKIHSENAGLIAACAAAFYGPLFFSEQIFIPEALSLPLYAVSFYFAVCFWETPSVRKDLGLGVLLGLAALTKAGILLFVICFCVVNLFKKRFSALVCLASALLVLSPVTLHNLITGKDFVLLTSHAGFNFYIGNNPRANGTFVAPEGTGSNVQDQIADSKHIAEAELGRELKPSEVSKFWSDKAWWFIRENPGTFFKLCGRKILLFFDAREISDVDDYVFCRNFVPFLNFPWLNFAVLGPLTLLGLGIAWKSVKYPGILYLWVGTYLLGLATFFTNARYRLPLLSVFFVLGGISVCELYFRIKARSWGQLSFFGLILVLGVGVTRSNLLASTPTVDYVNAGDAFTKMKMWDPAAEQYRKALEIEPDSAKANQAMGVLLTAGGRPDEAAPYYFKSLDKEPANALIYNNLGLWRDRNGRTEEAQRYFLKALEIKPTHAQAHNNLGMLYGRAGENEKAAKEFEESLKVNPENPRTLTNMGLVLYRMGEKTHARECWKKALQIDPDFADAKRAVAVS